MNIAAGSLVHHSRKMGIRESPRMRDRDEEDGRQMARVRRFCKEKREAADKGETIAERKRSREAKLRGGFAAETKLLARI